MLLRALGLQRAAWPIRIGVALAAALIVRAVWPAPSTAAPSGGAASFTAGMPANASACSVLLPDRQASSILGETVHATFGSNPQAQEAACFWYPVPANRTEILVDFTSSATPLSTGNASTTPDATVGHGAVYDESSQTLFVDDGHHNFAVSIDGGAASQANLDTIATTVLLHLP